MPRPSAAITRFPAPSGTAPHACEIALTVAVPLSSAGPAALSPATVVSAPVAALTRRTVEPSPIPKR